MRGKARCFCENVDKELGLWEGINREKKECEYVNIVPGKIQ